MQIVKSKPSMMKNLYQTLLLCCSLFFVGTHTVQAQDLNSDSLALVDLYNNNYKMILELTPTPNKIL